MVDKSNVLILLNLFGVTIIVSLLVLSKDFNSPDVIILALISGLILVFLDYMILTGTKKLVKSLQYKIQKTIRCPKCYTKVEKKAEMYCPKCGNKI